MDMARSAGKASRSPRSTPATCADLSELVLALDRLGVARSSWPPSCCRCSTPWAIRSTTPAWRQAGPPGPVLRGCTHTVSGAKAQVQPGRLWPATLPPRPTGSRRTSAVARVGHRRRGLWLVQRLLRQRRPAASKEITRIGVRMTLTGQVFALMGGIATDAAGARDRARGRRRYLCTTAARAATGSTRTSAGCSSTWGGCFGFAFGHKENGALFSHMAVMYANALYQRGLIVSLSAGPN
jgi:hypothetical protein